MGRVTIRDVAREAGVSTATASNAMNNPEIVRPGTRELVLATAERLGYVPNVNGQRLRARSTNTIGLFVNSMAGEYYGALADSMYRVCQDHGYELHICMVSDITSVLQKLRDHTLDGAVVFIDAIGDTEMDRMIASDCPLVFLGVERSEKHVSSIVYESRAHGRMAAQYLLGLGKRRMLHIFGLPGNYDSEERRVGFLEELALHGVKASDVVQLEGRFERAAAYREIRRYLQDGNTVPDAIFASNDLSATGCMAALKEAGLRIPEDVSHKHNLIILHHHWQQLPNLPSLPAHQFHYHNIIRHLFQLIQKIFHFPPT